MIADLSPKRSGKCISLSFRFRICLSCSIDHRRQKHWAQKDEVVELDRKQLVACLVHGVPWRLRSCSPILRLVQELPKQRRLLENGSGTCSNWSSTKIKSSSCFCFFWRRTLSSLPMQGRIIWVFIIFSRFVSFCQLRYWRSWWLACQDDAWFWA